MNYIIDEIKQHDTEFIKMTIDNKIINSNKFYVMYYKFGGIYDFISIKSGNELIQYGELKFHFDNAQIEIYEIVKEDELGIKNIYDIFYNFCINCLLNDFICVTDYIVFTIAVLDDYTNFNDYTLCYCTLEQYEKNLVLSECENTLIINNINDLDKYYDTVNQMQYTNIFLKLKNLNI
jgi:hypothetical protein